MEATAVLSQTNANPLAANSERKEQVAWINEEINNGNMMKIITECIDSNCLDDLSRQGNIKFIDAQFENLLVFKNVLIKIPPIGDKLLKQNDAHICIIPGDADLEKPLQIISVPKHWHRTLIPEKGVRILRNFYTTSMLGFHAVADMTVQIKTDFYSGRQELAINYRNIRPRELASAQFIEKLFVTSGQAAVPGTDKFISIEPIKKKNQK